MKIVGQLIVDGGRSSSPAHPQSFSGSNYGYFSSGAAAGAQAPSAVDDEVSLEMKREAMHANIVPVIIGLILMSFVVAAGVEETMKHFIVRCCQFPSSLRDPSTILVYMVAGALGFATAENIEYVFGTTTSPIPGTSQFVGELLVLLIRVCMPVHVICSVIQASSLSKMLMGHQTLSLFYILLPAILLHGTFDFVLFLLGAIEFIYNDSSLLLEIMSIVLSILITIAGGLYAYFSYRQAKTSFEAWQLISNDENDFEMDSTSM